jgi:hypothetical protein
VPNLSDRGERQKIVDADDRAAVLGKAQQQSCRSDVQIATAELCRFPRPLFDIVELTRRFLSIAGDGEVEVRLLHESPALAMTGS